MRQFADVNVNVNRIPASGVGVRAARCGSIEARSSYSLLQK